SCRTAYDEFVIVCRGEQGANSQRRLNHISERLWNYQLRGIGACSILFSWGGVEVQDQPLAEAIASATERMRETKRIGNPRAHLLAVCPTLLRVTPEAATSSPRLLEFFLFPHSADSENEKFFS